MAEMVHTPPRTPDTTEEPLAVIGMSCRFAPDLDTPGQLWEFLRAGRSAVGEMPARRWDPYEADPKTRAILRQTTRKGSFMQDIEGFDAEFFQITPREAEYIDPQQRIMLEMAWEALCDAGLPPTSLARHRRRRLRGRELQRLRPPAAGGPGPHRRLGGQRHHVLRHRQPHLVLPGRARPEHGGRHRLRRLPDRAARGVPGAAQR